MYDYEWDYFPGRLHTTREIIFFLENINNINSIINSNPGELTNTIFGDIYHPAVINDSLNFINKNVNKNISKIIMEISSRKISYYNDIPINYYYSRDYKEQYNLIDKILTDEEVEDDLIRLISLCKSVFNKNIEIHIIPHLNLKTKSSLDYIYDRNDFINLLVYLCEKYNIKIHNVGKYIENNTNNECFLEDYMEDLTHYSKYYEIIKAFLINEIIGVVN
jgi:hypothetical protein